ncbi:hypothetical protein Celal_3867 [Cellulophaga algicola DSM 14237]|uniref:Uncharacterized protein n=1 Tax=Cellulophaga algicola (strain DSM 14237 / IC166 / ACAM 630) TaxID=688270 RepID=E6XBK0_CELAD|nr:hypothetical protein Celal_3867 [Cellulophaga algicola DSM 14237]
MFPIDSGIASISLSVAKRSSKLDSLPIFFGKWVSLLC